MKKFFVILGVVFLIIIVAFVIFGGITFFNAYKLMPSVQNFITDFYKQYNNQSFSYIYNAMSDKKFRDAVTYEDFEKLMNRVYQKVGMQKDQKRGAWRINYVTDGVYFNIQYSVSYKNGKSIDTFVLKKYNNSWLLVNYNINSKDLLK